MRLAGKIAWKLIERKTLIYNLPPQEKKKKAMDRHTALFIDKICMYTIETYSKVDPKIA